MGARASSGAPAASLVFGIPRIRLDRCCLADLSSNELLLCFVPSSNTIAFQRNQRSALRTFLCRLATKCVGLVRQVAGPSHDPHFAAAVHDPRVAVCNAEHTYGTALTRGIWKRSCRRVSISRHHLRSQWRLPTSQIHPARRHARCLFKNSVRVEPPIGRHALSIATIKGGMSPDQSSETWSRFYTPNWEHAATRT